MTRFIAAKASRAILSLLIVTAVIFALGRLSGDPVRLLLSADATSADVAALRSRLGLDKPLLEQYSSFMLGLLHGDMGESIRYGSPVRELIVSRLPNTIALATIAIVFAALVAVPVGVMAAHRPRGWIDRFARVGALLGQSIPTYVVGILLVLLFAVRWQVFPTSNMSSPSSFVLPAVTLGWFAMAAITRITRSSTREALDSNYVTVARSKGLPESIVLFRHALRNAGTAIITITALQFVLFANGAVVVEAIFNWPGIGLLAFDAALGRDFPLLQGLVIFTAFITIAVNLLIDVAYGAVDRRISHVET